MSLQSRIWSSMFPNLAPEEASRGEIVIDPAAVPGPARGYQQSYGQPPRPPRRVAVNVPRQQQEEEPSGVAQGLARLAGGIAKGVIGHYSEDKKGPGPQGGGDDTLDGGGGNVDYNTDNPTADDPVITMGDAVDTPQGDVTATETVQDPQLPQGVQNDRAWSARYGKGPKEEAARNAELDGMMADVGKPGTSTSRADYGQSTTPTQRLQESTRKALQSDAEREMQGRDVSPEAPGIEQGSTAKQRAKWAKEPLPYENDPNKTATENRLAKAQYDARNATNENHGVKGFIQEALQNFFHGLAQRQPDMDWKQTLALGGASVGAGALDRGWNERRAAERDIPGLERQVQQEQQSTRLKSTVNNTNVDNDRADRALQLKYDDEDRKYETSVEKLKFSEADKDRIYGLRRDILQARKDRDERSARTAQARLDQMIRHQTEMEAQGGRRVNIAESKAGISGAAPSANQERFIAKNPTEAKGHWADLDRLGKAKGATPAQIKATKQVWLTKQTPEIQALFTLEP